ncbi:MAG: excinuclease ABC subunit A [Anaerolineaceae bacterium]|nr:excinuclease ABC subunit A [Anaerolineaceae bacterium]
MRSIDYSKLPLRTIFCIDVKSFFASVEAVRRGLDPLQAYIVVVSGLNRPGGIVLASSPKMKSVFKIQTGNRKFEIPHDPRILIVPPSMDVYLQKNREINAIFSKYAATEDILTYSIDESLLDLTATLHLFGDPMTTAIQIRDTIKADLDLSVTIGIGDNPLLAKLALDNASKTQESQIAYWSYENIPETVWKIPKLRSVWGISRGWEKRLNQIGIYSVFDLAHADPKRLEAKFGIMGLQQYYHANGVDYSRISERVEHKSKSYSKGQVLMHDYDAKDEILIIIREMVDDVAARLRRYNVLCSVANLGIVVGKGYSDGFGIDCRLGRPTNLSYELNHVFIDMFLSRWSGSPVRQIYISCTLAKGNAEDFQAGLFTAQYDLRCARLDRTLDEIHERFGKTSIFRATALLPASTYFLRSGYVGGHQGYAEVPSAMA